MNRNLALHGGLIALLFVVQFVLPNYHHGIVAQIMVLAIYAMAYNIIFGYTGMLSLGHSLLFGAGMYALGMGMVLLQLPAEVMVVGAFVAGGLLALIIGALAMRTAGVSFMIVTLMFAQVGYLAVIYFNEYTKGDQGFPIQQHLRQAFGLNLTQIDVRYNVALVFFAIIFGLMYYIRQSRFGRVLIAIRENPERTMMMGYNIHAYKLMAFTLSGALAGLSGGLFALLFGFAGANFVAIPYSIFPLLWVLVGGAGTIIGPIVGVLVMYYLRDIVSQMTSSYMLFVGLALVIMIIKAPEGIMGFVRKKWLRDLP